MANPTFNGFSLNDANFITERVTFKGYADRELMRGKINRREGVSLMDTEFGEKKITVEGVVIASTPTELQTLLDNLKKNLTAEDASLIIEQGRAFTATVQQVNIPDEHYNQSKTDFEVTFICSKPFAEGDQVAAVMPVNSGVYTFSGLIVISGTMFNRPTITYDPPTVPASGHTNITKMDFYHIPTGQTVTVSGFNSGTNLPYEKQVIVNMDDFTSLEGTTTINNAGGFPKWEPGTNDYTITVSGAFPGGSVTVSHQPRYL